MLKRIGIIFTVMLIGLFFVLPISANRTDVVLDQQVTLGVPGSFELVDSNQDQKPEALKVKVKVNSYREGNFIATGKLEAQQGEAWVEVGVTVQPFQWSTTNDTLEFTFQSDLIREQKLSGPYRASVSLREGDWELPLQVVGFSPTYSWERFTSDSQVSPGEAVSDLAQAKRVAEIWARLKSFKLGKLLRVEYNYDRWNLDYQNKKNSGILRVMISPQGGIETMNIKEIVPFDPEK